MVISSTRYKRIVVLTGAGVSVASGLPTYRGAGGLWTKPDTVKLSTLQDFETESDSYWKFWGKLKAAAAQSSPNQAHIALADWERKLTSEQKFTLITQNVDELHQRAGSSNVVELHGSVFQTRCSDTKCASPPFRDPLTYEQTPLCKECGSALRPDIVLFDEMLPAQADWNSKRALRDCDLFIAVGTSGMVSPASNFVNSAKYAQARTILINLEKMESRNPSFDEEIIGAAEEVLPHLLV